MSPPESNSPKRRRIDRYELQELVGEGGMGAVYRAIDSRLGRTVAVKTVVSDLTGGGLTDELRRRFMREAQAASRVEHRNVVQVIDFGVTNDGTPYLVMEYLRGRDLGALLKRTPTPLSIGYVADVMLAVCAALRACHQVGIVHRDLKPSNIFLADTDIGPEIKVLDFGVSKAPVPGDLTQEGQILGTPQYLSPEQVNGKVGPASDQYALGVLLYACLTRRLPFEEHQDLMLLRAIEVGRFLGPRAHRPEIPQALEEIILQAMRTDPSERFESVHALGKALWPFASPRGQGEWKNYYFPTPAMYAPSLGPTPVAPDLAIGRVTPSPAPLEPTAVVPDSPPAPRAVTSPPSPQLLVSTKLARPSAPQTPPEREPTATIRRRGPALLGGVIGLLAAAALLVVVRGQLASSRTPISSPQPQSPSGAGSPSAPVRASSNESPAASAPAGAGAPALTAPPSPSPPTEAQAPPSPHAPSRLAKRRNVAGAKRDHAPRAEQAPKTTGLDKNGIGIPVN
jgi:serine/threonine protein kinase